MPLILFWYDVSDFNKPGTIGTLDDSTGSSAYSQNSRLQHAWSIFNSYLSTTARFKIQLVVDDESLSDKVFRLLQLQSSRLRGGGAQNFKTATAAAAAAAGETGETYTHVDVFQPIMDHVVSYLESSWLEFIKDDVRKYTL